MAMMKCVVFYGSRRIKIEERPVPKIGRDDVLIKVEACGICGTDVSMYNGKITYGKHVVGKIFGHEVTGVVEDKGKDVDRVTIGGRVVIAPVNYCGKCVYCKQGNENICMDWMCIGEEMDGGYAQYLRVSQKQVFNLTDKIGFEEGTLLADPVPTPLHAVRAKAQIKPGDIVAIWGSGPQGYCALQLAKLSGATVLMIVRRKEKIRLAYKLGADVAVDSSTQDVVETTRGLFERGVDCCIESGGYPDALTQSVACVKKGGRVVMIGLQKSMACNLEDMLWGEKELVASLSATYKEFAIGIKLAESGKIKLQPLVTHRFSLDSIDDAFDMLTQRKKSVIKVVIRP
jgi:L-iditol 2-dehydrogenase